MVLPGLWSAPPSSLGVLGSAHARVRIQAGGCGLAASSWDAAGTQLSAFLFASASQRWYRVWCAMLLSASAKPPMP